MIGVYGAFELGGLAPWCAPTLFCKRRWAVDVRLRRFSRRRSGRARSCTQPLGVGRGPAVHKVNTGEGSSCFAHCQLWRYASRLDVAMAAAKPCANVRVREQHWPRNDPRVRVRRAAGAPGSSSDLASARAGWSQSITLRRRGRHSLLRGALVCGTRVPSTDMASKNNWKARSMAVQCTARITGLVRQAGERDGGPSDVPTHTEYVLRGISSGKQCGSCG